MIDLGDREAGTTIYFVWPSVSRNRASANRTTAGTMKVYKNASTTSSTTGVTDTSAFNGVTGLNHCTINTSADTDFYAAGNDYTIVVEGAVIDGQTVNGPIAAFSIENRVRDQILPLVSTVRNTEVTKHNLVAYQYHQTTFTFTIVDSEGEAIDLSAKTVKFKAYNRPDETTAFQRATGGTGVTVSGSGGNVVTITVTGVNTATAKTYGFVLVNDTDDEMLSFGTLTVQEGADVT